jgi:hypothetical protein
MTEPIAPHREEFVTQLGRTSATPRPHPRRDFHRLHVNDIRRSILSLLMMPIQCCLGLLSRLIGGDVALANRPNRAWPTLGDCA